MGEKVAARTGNEVPTPAVTQPILHTGSQDSQGIFARDASAALTLSRFSGKWCFACGSTVADHCADWMVAPAPPTFGQSAMLMLADAPLGRIISNIIRIAKAEIFTIVGECD